MQIGAIKRGCRALTVRINKKSDLWIVYNKSYNIEQEWTSN